MRQIKTESQGSSAVINQTDFDIKTKEVDWWRGEGAGAVVAQLTGRDNGFNERTSDHSRVKFHHLRIIISVSSEVFRSLLAADVGRCLT